MKRLTRVTGTLATLVFGAFGPLTGPATAGAPGQDRGDAVACRPVAVTAHVIVISIDGLRPDAIEVFRMRTLERLMRQGSYSLDAQTTLPSRTLPSHASMLSGVSPDVHGITFNTEMIEEKGVIPVPTVFELARSHGLRTAAFYSKSKFRHLERDAAYDYWQAPTSNLDNWMATQTVPDAIRYLKHEKPNLLFVHLAEPDFAGHALGWMSTIYGWAVRRADASVARILDAAESAFGAGRFTLIVTSDHGGHGRDHGSDAPEDTTIPWIAWGEGVAVGAVPKPIRTMDTAATVLWLLGIGVPESWTGRPVVESFRYVPADL